MTTQEMRHGISNAESRCVRLRGANDWAEMVLTEHPTVL